MKSGGTVPAAMERTHRNTWGRLVAGAVAAGTLLAGTVALPLASADAAGNSRHANHHFMVGVSFYTNSPPYLQIRQGMEEEAQKLDITLSFSYAAYSAAEQTLQIGNFVSDHVNLILCSPLSISALLPAFRATRKAGVPIISIANKVASKDETGFIGRTWSFVGRDQMEFVDKELHGGGQIAEIAGPATIDLVQGEQRGWNSVLAVDKGLDLVATETDPTTARSTGGLALADDILTTYPNVKAIVVANDTVAVGVGEALQRRGLKPGSVVVTGLGAIPPVVTSIRDHGYIQFTISMKAVTWGVQAIEVTHQWLTGHKPKDSTIATAYQIVTPSNVTTLTTKDLL